jgi:hypothetical protein
MQGKVQQTEATLKEMVSQLDAAHRWGLQALGHRLSGVCPASGFCVASAPHVWQLTADS